MRAVIDTNIVFEGVTTRGGAAGLVIDAWLQAMFEPCISTAMAYEYVDVLTRKLSKQRWKSLRPIFVDMLAQARFVEMNYTWRPSSPDPGDDRVIDCAMNANAVVVTGNLRDFRLAQETLGLNVMTAVEFLTWLEWEVSRSVR